MSHYDWLDENFFKFLSNLEIDDNIKSWNGGIVTAHGDKCYSYRNVWEDNGIPFEHGVALYLLTYISPYSGSCRNTDSDGWINPCDWVVVNYELLKEYLPKV